MITNEERLNLEARIADLENKKCADLEARISWQDSEVEGLQKKLAIKDAKFDQLCRDMDARNEYVEELKRIIASLRGALTREKRSEGRSTRDYPV